MVAPVGGVEFNSQHNPTAATVNSEAADPLGLTTKSGQQTRSTFCPTDWVLKISPVDYKVTLNESGKSQAKRRNRGRHLSVADQIVGFKVASIYMERGRPPPAMIITTSTPRTYCFRLLVDPLDSHLVIGARRPSIQGKALTEIFRRRTL